jgi:hypothetical protein
VRGRLEVSGLDVHTCAVTRALDTRAIAEDVGWMVVRNGDPIPEGHFLIASAADCPEGCSIWHSGARRV